MSNNENAHSEYSQLVKIWREALDEYEKVMDPITLAFTKSETPPHEYLVLAESLLGQVASDYAKVKEFQANLFNRQRGSDSP